ncbi:DUF3159 domain-containing protein [Prauserella cavernicola]|uniref:DUF3159 domain-containing protein n=1 Tax=Prauserella cavernicola TaxID=2800127 RepID=A0A934QN77_9PSEU|nr:DUF3159 domain-containing protein [Prauserella cavernicola]MBK1783726.1 DUF3159 domain-containing protein [Prauserella cavernicola]
MTEARTVRDRQPRRAGNSVMDQLGGPIGLVYTGLPVVVFVIVNSVFGLQPAIVIALGLAAAVTVFRLVRKEPFPTAVSGLLGVGVAAFVAYQTGSAKGFFLLGIWTNAIGAALLLVSILVRWPLVGVLVNAVTGKGTAWRSDRGSMLAFDLATATLTVLFAARFVVQQWLYDENSTGWLAFARLAMGYPLLALAFLVVLWAARHSSKRLKHRGRVV